MTAILILAALTAGGWHVAGDSVLASSAASTVPADAVPVTPPGVSAMSTGEQIDVWWAEDGARRIAEAVRPTPAVPAGLDVAGLQAGMRDLRLTLQVSATTGR